MLELKNPSQFKIRQSPHQDALELRKGPSGVTWLTNNEQNLSVI